MPELKAWFILPALLALFSCKQKPGLQDNTASGGDTKYARHFSLKRYSDHTVLALKGKRNSQDTTVVFVLYKNRKPQLQFRQETYNLQVPCQRMVVLSSIYASMFADLDSAKGIVAIDNMDYVCHPLIRKKFDNAELAEVGKGPEPDLEKLIGLHPDLVLMFGMGNPDSERKPALRESGIAQALVVDHLEGSALARAEWIKFFAAFAGKDAEADSIFAQVEKSYLQLKDSLSGVPSKPLVLTELQYGETWYVPGGKSFMAGLIEDAGARHPWSEDGNSGSLPLSFEQVYRKANQADVWINLSMATRASDLLQQDKRYAAFKAFKTGKLYNNNKRVNEKGYSEYWESAMYHPERLLRDLANIFHNPSLQEKDLYYYRRLN